VTGSGFRPESATIAGTDNPRSQSRPGLSWSIAWSIVAIGIVSLRCEARDKHSDQGEQSCFYSESATCVFHFLITPG